jgi:hypothetical protein
MIFTGEIIARIGAVKQGKIFSNSFHKELKLTYYSNYEHGINIRI